MTSPLGLLRCDVGRTAFYGGRWSAPCGRVARHEIRDCGTGAPQLQLCETHFDQVNRAGLIDHPYVYERAPDGAVTLLRGFEPCVPRERPTPQEEARR